MSATQVPTVSSRDGVPCPSCRAPLAGDQRYCLNCGTRHPEARSNAIDVLTSAEATQSSPISPAFNGVAQPAGGGPPLTGVPYRINSSTPPPTGVKGWLTRQAPWLSLGGFIAGVLIIGLLIGH